MHRKITLRPSSGKDKTIKMKSTHSCSTFITTDTATNMKVQ